MTELTSKIRKLEKYSKALGEVRFTVSIIKGAVTVKLWKKYNVCTAPDKDSGEMLIESLNTAVANQKTKIDQVLSLLNERCEQLEIQLFSKDQPDGTNDGFKPGESRCDTDSNREHSSGEEPA